MDNLAVFLRAKRTIGQIYKRGLLFANAVLACAAGVHPSHLCAVCACMVCFDDPEIKSKQIFIPPCWNGISVRGRGAEASKGRGAKRGGARGGCPRARSV